MPNILNVVLKNNEGLKLRCSFTDNLCVFLHINDFLVHLTLEA